jgi:hypothetical protein
MKITGKNVSKAFKTTSKLDLFVCASLKSISMKIVYVYTSHSLCSQNSLEL